MSGTSPDSTTVRSIARARPTASSSLASGERRALVRGVAERALLEARRNGLGVEELVTMIWEVSAEDDAEGAGSTSAVRPGREGGVA